MNLPEIVRRIGCVNEEPCIYIEDYVYSYLNGLREKKDIFPLRAALFGHMFQKENKNCYLIYGACGILEALEYGKTEEQVRKEFFEDYQLVGYVNLVKKTPLSPEKSKGYFIFYETNEAMQNYLSFCYEKEKRKNGRRGQDEVCFRAAENFQSEKKGGLIKHMVRHFLTLISVIILATAVCAINDYGKIYGFVEMADKAAWMLEVEK